MVMGLLCHAITMYSYEQSKSTQFTEFETYTDTPEQQKIMFDDISKLLKNLEILPRLTRLLK